MNRYGFYPITAEEVADFWPHSTDVDKLYFYLVKSEFNYAGSDNFRRSDAWFAAAIGCSLSAIRQSRRGLQAKGMINYEAGWRRAGKGLAGRYVDIDGLKVTDGIFWARVGFYKLHMLLSQLRKKTLTRETVVLMLLLDFYRMKFELAHEDNFFIQKHELRTATRADDTFKIIRQLHENFRYGGTPESRLFEYKIKYHRVEFLKFGDPGEMPDNFDRWRSEIKTAASKLEQPKTLKKPWTKAPKSSKTVSK